MRAVAQSRNRAARPVSANSLRTHGFDAVAVAAPGSLLMGATGARTRHWEGQMSTHCNRLVAAFAIVVLGSAVRAQAQWVPPMGIPAPAFGITQVAPATPAPWTTAVAGFYYVNATGSGATDSSNPYGTPAKPRVTIPTVLPAGAVVELHGTYDTTETSPNTLVANGTVTSPVFIRGVSATARPLIRSGWEVSGTYVILENLEFGPASSTQTGALVFLAPLNHAALRTSDLHGTLTDGGLAVESWTAALTQNVVLVNNTIHDNGDVNADFDQDVHGIVVSARVSNLWVVDNQLYRNSGDGIQINAGSAADQATTHHIYVGRNTAYANKQTGFWAKQAVDVIFSQNICHSHRASNSSLGQCMGYQYATQQAWFLFNTIYDSEYGIGIMSDSDQGTGTDAYMIGNVIYNIHHADAASYNPQTAWSNAGIMLAGGINHHVINNTLYDVDGGIHVPEGTVSHLDLTNNIVSTVTVAASSDVFIESDATAAAMMAQHNLYDGDPRMRLGGAAQQHLTAAQLNPSGSLSANPLFVNPAGANFRLQAASPALDAGVLDAAYATFQQRYGLSISKDADGTARPLGLGFDLGAFEANGTAPVCGAPTVPPAPTQFAATVTGSTIAFQWTATASTCNPATGYWFAIGTASGKSDGGAGPTGSLATTLSTPNVKAGTYYIRVMAQDSTGLSVSSNEVVATVTAAGLGAPTALIGSAAKKTVSLRWTAPTGLAATGYVLQVGTAAGRTDATLALTTPATTWTAAGAATGTYYLRILATVGAASSLASNEVVVVVR